MVWKRNWLYFIMSLSINRIVLCMRGGLPGQKDDILWGNLTRKDYANAWRMSETQNIAVLETIDASETVFKWPNNTVYYTIDNNFPGNGRIVLNNALDLLRTTTCVKFEEIERYSRKNYLFVTAEGPTIGCSSYLGMYGDSEQVLQLSDGCYSIATVYHEFMHALGFDHEHTRPDRDSYVTIHWDNIRTERGYREQFDKYPSDVVNLQGVEYDYASVMHYESHAFTKIGGGPTITTHIQNYPDGSPVVIGGKTISENDKLKINLWYNCPNTTSPENMTWPSTTTTTPGPVTNPCPISIVTDTNYVNCARLATRQGCSVPRIRGACQLTCGSTPAKDVSHQRCAVQSVRRGCCNQFMAGSCFSTCKQSSFPKHPGF